MKLPFLFVLQFFALNLFCQPNPVADFYVGGFASSIAIANAGDGTDRLFIVERDGRIKIIDAGGTVLATNFLDIVTLVSTVFEGGMLGLAFHPDYATNGFFFVNYTNTNGDTQIDRFTVNSTNPNIADPASQVNLLTINQPFGNHNAGDLAFGPDGFLYIPMGDGGGGPNCGALDGLEMLGKVLRLDVDQNINTMPYYGIPSSNPYIGNPNFLDEIWAVGLRNPWRFSFDRLTGDMWIADVGQGSWEEVNFQLASSTGGENYGWTVKEGYSCFGSPNCPAGTPPCSSSVYDDPIFVYDHGGNGGPSITGGYVYRGCQYPEMQGYYICADAYSGNMWSVLQDGSFTLHSISVGSIVSFGESESGELYMCSLNGGVYQMTSGTAVTCDNECPFDAAITNDSPVCFGDAVNFVVSPSDANNYNFFLDENINGMLDAGESLQNSSSNTFTSGGFLNGAQVGVQITDADNCIVIALTTVSVYGDLPLVLTANDPVCEGEDITFVVSPGSAPNYDFFHDMNTNEMIDAGELLQSGSSNIYTNNSFSNGDLIAVIVTDEFGCLNNAAYVVTVTPGVTAVITSNSPVCGGEEFIFAVSPSNANFYEFFIDLNFNGVLDGGELLQSGTMNIFSSTSLNNGNVIGVRVTGDNNCSDIATTTIMVLENPIAIIASDAPQCEGEDITFAAAPANAVNFEFFVNGNSMQFGGSSVFISNTLMNGNMVSVEVTNNNGCVDQAITSVSVLPSSDPNCMLTCPPDYADGGNGALTGTINSTQFYETNGPIDSYQTLSVGADVDYDSAIEIELKIGFECQEGAELDIYIDGCEEEN